VPSLPASPSCAHRINRANAGFFEALRAEMDLVKAIGEDESPIKITIVCPPTVSSNLRQNSLTTDTAFKNIADKGALSPRAVAGVIVDAADRGLRKVYFPFSAFFGVYIRPFFPDFVDFFAQRKAKL
jgi:short-subunit dehydrogenase